MTISGQFHTVFFRVVFWTGDRPETGVLEAFIVPASSRAHVEGWARRRVERQAHLTGFSAEIWNNAHGPLRPVQVGWFPGDSDPATEGT